MGVSMILRYLKSSLNMVFGRILAWDENSVMAIITIIRRISKKTVVSVNLDDGFLSNIFLP